MRFDTSGEVLTDRRGRHDENYFELLFDPWYPRTPQVGSAGFTSRLKVRTRAPFRPIASGRLLSEHEERGIFEVETESPASVQGPVVLAGKYRTSEAAAGAVAIRSDAYAEELQETQEKIPKLAGRFLEFYESLLGPYPFGKLDIVEIPESLMELGDPFHCVGVAWGQLGVAPAGLVLMSSDAYNPYQLRARLEAYRGFMNTHGDPRSSTGGGRRDWSVSRGVNARLAHEIAHQWFPHQAWPATRRDAWLAESLAEYLSGLAMSAMQTDPRDVEGFAQQFAGWQFEARGCANVGSLETAMMLTGESAGRDSACLVYDRGPLVLHMLRTLVGNDRFFMILRRFLETGRVRPVTTDDFREAIEAVLGTDMGWFIDEWVRRGGIPDITIHHEVHARPTGGFVLAGRVTQADGPTFKKIHIPFVLEMDDGRRELRLLFQEKPVQEFSFDLPSRPRKISVDPGRNNLAVYH